jgi:hypothetical protein
LSRLLCANKDNLLDRLPQPDSFQNGPAMRAIEFPCDLITFSKHCPLDLIVIIVCFLLLVFCFVPFGVVFCGAIFIAMMKIGFNLIFLKPSLGKREGIANKVAATGETASIRVYETLGTHSGRGPFGETPDSGRPLLHRGIVRFLRPIK